jgi:hypothetical protein
MEQDFSIPPPEPTPPTPALHIDASSRLFLQQTTTWAKFLAIFGFVMCGLIVIAAFFMGSIISSYMSMGVGDDSLPSMGMFGGFITVFYLALAVLLFFPNLYLLNFANKMQVALGSDDQPTLTQSFKFLRAYYRYIGIMLIVLICFYFLVFLIMLASAF